MTNARRMAEDRRAAEVTLYYLQHMSDELKRVFDSPDPTVIRLPNIMFADEPSMHQTRAQVSIDYEGAKVESELALVEAVTRPMELQLVYGRLSRLLGIQRKPHSSQPGIIMRGMCSPLNSGLFLRGCKGIGKSYLMLLTAVQLLVRERSARVVYIGDCGAWKKCGSKADRESFIAEAFAAAFADDQNVLELVDKWRSNSLRRTWPVSPCLLFKEIERYCRDNGLVVAVFIDKTNELAGLDYADREILALIKSIKCTRRFSVILAASDDCIADAVNEGIRASDLRISQPFSSSEASLFVRWKCPGVGIGPLHLKDFMNVTWRHPGELRRLCSFVLEAFKNADNGHVSTPSALVDDTLEHDEVISRCLERFGSMPCAEFAPKPFTTALGGFLPGLFAERVSQSVMSVLLMRGHAHQYLVDYNYMTLSTIEGTPCFIYPSPKIAEGLVRLHCAAKGSAPDMKYHLENMRRATYQIPVQ
ncbi:hypothetical protein GQ54DRAFT_309469 [Martensiomyces pterosporus]|nr:hypothetical protein GQ54DRAFT_309469 [Martensiomyces pterosporus]